MSPRGKPGSGKGAKKRRTPIQLEPRWCIRCSTQFTPAQGRYGARQIYCSSNDTDYCLQDLYKVTRSLTFEFVQAAQTQGYQCAVCGVGSAWFKTRTAEKQPTGRLASQETGVEPTTDTVTATTLQAMLILTWMLPTPDNIVAVCKSCKSLWYQYLSQMPPSARERMSFEVLTLSELNVFLQPLQPGTTREHQRQPL